MTSKRNKSLGMDQPIARRDFLQGAAIGTVAAVAGLAPAGAAQQSEPQDAPDYYPPTRLGMRGSIRGRSRRRMNCATAISGTARMG